MRKLFVMLVVMAVVFGMSAGVMAQLAEESLDVNITAEEIAVLEHNLNNGLEMNIEDLNNNPFQSERGTFTITANTSVAIAVEQNYTNVSDVFPDHDSHQIFWGESNNDNWIIAPNIQIPKINGVNTANHSNWAGSRPSNAFDIGGVVGQSEEVLNFNSAGINTFELYMDVSINSDYDWYEFNADETLEGNLVVTVSAL